MIVSFINTKVGRITFKRVTSLSYVPKSNKYHLKYYDFMHNLHVNIIDGSLNELEVIYDD